MPLLSWPAFREAHGKAYMVFADLEDGTRRQTRFALLGALVRVMAFKGAYAMKPEDTLIRVTFERGADALLFAQGLGARKTAREGGWAGQWSFLFDAEAEATIKAVLPAAKRRAREPGRAGGRLPRRLPG